MDRGVLRIDAAAETDRIVQWMKETMRGLHRTGVVVGISGGIDSSVCLALSVRAFGAERVVALLLPDKDSDPLSEDLARHLAAHYGVTPIRETVTPALEGYGCYVRRDEAIARVFPEYEPAAGYKAKIVLPAGLLDEGTLNVFSLTIVTPDGEEKSARLAPREFAQIVAASNFKQRSRTAMLYYHAELNNYAVVGTPNKNERDQGFFVKYGDGGYDFAPIAHLYKTQVYQLARHLDVPEAIQTAHPHDRYLQRAVDPGGVLLPPALRDHGPALVRPGARALCGGHRARPRDVTGPGAQRLRRLHAQAQDHALPARGTPGHGQPWRACPQGDRLACGRPYIACSTVQMTRPGHEYRAPSIGMRPTLARVPWSSPAKRMREHLPAED